MSLTGARNTNIVAVLARATVGRQTLRNGLPVLVLDQSKRRRGTDTALRNAGLVGCTSRGFGSRDFLIALVDGPVAVDHPAFSDARVVQASIRPRAYT
jgi:hypothetical protein